MWDCVNCLKYHIQSMNIRQCDSLTCLVQPVSLFVVIGRTAAAYQSTGRLCPSGKPLVRHTLRRMNERVCKNGWIQTGLWRPQALIVSVSFSMCLSVCLSVFVFFSCVNPKCGLFEAGWGEQRVSGTVTKDNQIYTQSQVRNTHWSIVTVSLNLMYSTPWKS